MVLPSESITGTTAVLSKGIVLYREKPDTQGGLWPKGGLVPFKRLTERTRG